MIDKELQAKINRIKETARKATILPWNCIQKYDEWENYVGPEDWSDMGESVCVCKYSYDADYVASVHPKIIMEIVMELEDLDKELTRIQENMHPDF